MNRNFGTQYKRGDRKVFYKRWEKRGNVGGTLPKMFEVKYLVGRPQNTIVESWINFIEEIVRQKRNYDTK